MGGGITDQQEEPPLDLPVQPAADASGFTAQKAILKQKHDQAMALKGKAGYTEIKKILGWITTQSYFKLPVVHSNSVWEVVKNNNLQEKPRHITAVVHQAEHLVDTHAGVRATKQDIDKILWIRDTEVQQWIENILIRTNQVWESKTNWLMDKRATRRKTYWKYVSYVEYLRVLRNELGRPHKLASPYWQANANGLIFQVTPQGYVPQC